MSFILGNARNIINNRAYNSLRKAKSTSSGVRKYSGGSHTATPTTVQNKNVGVRDYLKSAGLDESKIGWNNGQVTYGGRNFTPAENRDGVTYSDKKSLDSFISGIHADNGNIGVRKTFSDMGLDTSKLGWKDGHVTYNGISYAPSINSNGVTYGSKNDVMDFAAKALRSQGDDLVRVNRYRDNNGLYDVTWNDANKKVLIGGREVPYAYVDEGGNAWAKESDVSSAYKRLAAERGIRSPSEILGTWKTQADALENEYKQLADSKFTFDSDDLANDPVWQAYADMYQREAEKAYLDTLANTSARTGGSMSTMAQVAADEARNRMLKAKSDIIPTLAQQAYERYKDAYNIKSGILDKRYGLYGDMLNYGSTMSDKARTLYENEQAAERQRNLNSYADRATRLQLDAEEDNNRFQKLKNSYDAADLLNVPINEEIARQYGVSPDEYGNYPTPTQISVAKQQEIWDKYEKGIYDYETASELEKYVQQQTIAMEIALQQYAAQNEMDIDKYAQQKAIAAKYKTKSKTKSKSRNSSGGSGGSGGDLSLENEIKMLGGGF